VNVTALAGGQQLLTNAGPLVVWHWCFAWHRHELYVLPAVVCITNRDVNNVIRNALLQARSIVGLHGVPLYASAAPLKHQALCLDNTRNHNCLTATTVAITHGAMQLMCNEPEFQGTCAWPHCAEVH
jgi:hypothetical protein